MFGAIFGNEFVDNINKIIEDFGQSIGRIGALLLFILTVGIFIWSIAEVISWGKDAGPSIFMTAIYLIPAFCALDAHLALGIFDRIVEGSGFASSPFGIVVLFGLILVLPMFLCVRSLIATLFFANSAFSLTGGFGSQAYRVCYALYSFIFLVGIPILMFVI